MFMLTLLVVVVVVVLGVALKMSLLAPIFFEPGEGLLMASSERGAGQRNEKTKWVLKLQHLRLFQNHSRTRALFRVAVSICGDPVGMSRAARKNEGRRLCRAKCERRESLQE